MRKGISAGQAFYLICKHCGNDYDLIEAKRETRRTQPIRCPNCGAIVAK